MLGGIEGPGKMRNGLAILEDDDCSQLFVTGVGVDVEGDREIGMCQQGLGANCAFDLVEVVY